MKSTTPGISFIVPVFNSAGTLGNVIESIEREALKFDVPFELILVNDGSIDASWNVIKSASATHPWITGINLVRNFGQHNALLCGIRQAQYDISITLDDDLQNPPSEIHKLLRKMEEENLSVVYGVPKNLHHGFLRNCASKMTKLILQKSMGAETAQRVSAFRAFRTKVRDAFAAYHNPFINLDVLLTWGASRFGHVFVEHHARAQGTSSYTLPKLVTHSINMLTGFSTIPLQLASLNGLMVMMLGFLLFAYVVLKFLIQGSPVPGFTFLASVVLLFSGAQLLALGIIGEYVGRIYARTMDKPPYQVDSILAGGVDDDGAEAAERCVPRALSQVRV